MTLKTALPALLVKVKADGARTLAESSVEAVAQALDGMIKDPVLSVFPFDQASFTEIVYRVIRSGTVLERSALAKYLTPKAACFFPSIERQIEGSFENLQASIDQVLKPMFKILADHFGVTFNGDPDSVAYSILQEFGGLSIADLLIFFERAKTGRYRLEFQHIQTRGINADFLFSWLEQYVQEKTLEVEEMYQRFKYPDAGGNAEETNARQLADIRRGIDQKAKEREDLLSRARNARIEYEAGLYESVVIPQAFKFQAEEVVKVDDAGPVVGPDGKPVLVRIQKEVICNSDDPGVTRTEILPFRILKEGAIDKLVKRAIFEFVTFGKAKETIELFELYKAKTWAKYEKEGNVADLVTIEFKYTLTQISALKRSLNLRDLIEASLQRQKIKGSPGQIRRYCNDTLRGFEDDYFAEYLPYCFRVNCPPMTKDEYSLSVLLEYLVSIGDVNPFKMIFE